MACPYFEPRTKFRDAITSMPLGDVWSGICRANAGAPHEPDVNALTEFCNMGYARGKCPSFPDTTAPDAVRFMIARDQDQMIQIAYVTERDHHPHAHGSLEYSRAAAAFPETCGDPLLEKQAQAYALSYVRRRPAAA